MTAAELVVDSLRSFVLTLPYRKVTVNMLCDDTGVSRTTFYKVFSSKDDVLIRAIAQDICNPVKDIRNAVPKELFHQQLSSMIDETQLANIKKHAAFYKAIMHECPNFLMRILVDLLTETTAEAIEDLSIPIDEKEYTATLYAGAHALLIWKWIADDMAVPIKQCAEWHRKWAIGAFIDFAKNSLIND